jgi:hypothetical protein
VELEPEEEEGQLDWPCALLMTMRGELWTVASQREGGRARPGRWDENGYVLCHCLPPLVTISVSPSKVSFITAYRTCSFDSYAHVPLRIQTDGLDHPLSPFIPVER